MVDGVGWAGMTAFAAESGRAAAQIQAVRRISLDPKV
jgi:hypothetical protein